MSVTEEEDFFFFFKLRAMSYIELTTESCTELMTM